MYDYFGYILVSIIGLLGLIEFLFPKQCTKKELRESREDVAKIRKTGLFLAVVAVVALFFLFCINNQ